MTVRRHVGPGARRRSARRLARTTVAAIGALFALSACAPGVDRAVVGVVVDSCDPGEEVGSGMVVAPGLAITSAHVVAGARAITVERRGGRFPAEIVGFDPDMDLAYLAFSTLPGTYPSVASEHVRDGDAGTAFVVRDGDTVELPVTVRRRVRIRTEDIYIQGETLRPGFELDADIESGDSGGAVVVDGEVVGVIWARSNRFDRRAYAIDAVRAATLIEEQRAAGDLGDDVDVTRCH